MSRLTPQQALARAIEHAGGVAPLARLVGVSLNAAFKWKRRKEGRLPISPRVAGLIEIVTHHKVTAAQLLYVPKTPKP